MDNVILPPGQIVVPIAGTIHWAENSKPLGVWGQDLKIRPMLLEADGEARDLNALECALFERTHGGSF